MNRLKKSLSGILEMPKEVIYNLPLITLSGKEEINIENYKGIIEYSEDLIRINTNCGVLRIEGKKLLLKQVTDENIQITGIIIKLEYLV